MLHSKDNISPKLSTDEPEVFTMVFLKVKIKKIKKANA